MATTRLENETIFLVPTGPARTTTFTSSTLEVRGSRVVAYLNCTAATGTSETLDVVIKAISPNGSDVTTLGTFTQLTDVGQERLVTGLDPLLDHNIVAVCTIGGSTPVFTFTVTLVVKES